MHADFGVFSAGGRAASTQQYVQDSAVAAAASFAMLVLQQQVMHHARNDFQTMAWLLLSLVALQLAAKWWTQSRQNATTQQFLDAFARAEMVYRLPLNGARIVVQCYIRADALHHFGFLFAFLLENVDSLLLQPLRDALQASSSTTKSSNTWMFLLAGYLLVAGVDAYEYGSLFHTIVLIALALGMKHAEHAMVENKFRLEASPHFHLLSLVCACAMALPLSWIIAPRARRIGIDTVDYENGQEVATSAAWWMFCGFGVAALHLTSMYFHRNPLSKASSRNRWISVMVCTVTGLVGSLFVSAFEDDWLRFVADLVAAIVIVYAQFSEMIRLSTEQHRDEVELDMFRSASSSLNKPTGNPTDVTQILSALWERDDSRKMLMFLSVNVSYMVIELLVGIWSNSLGLIGDAGHMFFDNGALLIGLVASYIGKLPADAQYTYGYGRVEVLSGFLNSVLLLFMASHLIAEGFSRLMDPPDVKTDNLLLTSVIGLGVNIVGLVWFHDSVHGHGHGEHDEHGHGHSHSHSHGSNSNMYGVYLHVLADTLGSVGVIVSSLLIQFKGWYIADPISSVMIALLILGSTLSLLKDTLLQLLQRTPKELENQVADALREIETSVPHVLRIVQWHVWRHSSDVSVASIHVVVDTQANEQLVLRHVQSIFSRRAGVSSKFLSVQVEKSEVLLNGEHDVYAKAYLKNLELQNHNHGHDHAHDHGHDHSHDHGHNHSHNQKPSQPHGQSHNHSHAHAHNHSHGYEDFPENDGNDHHSQMSTHENPAGDDVMHRQYHQHQQPVFHRPHTHNPGAIGPGQPFHHGRQAHNPQEHHANQHASTPSFLAYRPALVTAGHGLSLDHSRGGHNHVGHSHGHSHGDATHSHYHH